jgi:hypothetical protein
VAEGYVSRIKVSAWGYGKTLYITHPNGYVTVYAHLKEYKGKIQEYVKGRQYEKETYGMELFPPRNLIKVEKGEIVALSGNTGGSSGPHLHFEIRNAITGYPVNPLLFGFNIVDSINPVVRNLRIYPLNNASHVNKKDKPQYFTIFGSKGNYEIVHPNPIPVYGEVGLAVETYDFLNGSHNKCGIYSIALQHDDKRVYYHEMETYGFHENRYINSHVDYGEFKRKGKHLQKSFIAPNNQLGIYREAQDRGIISCYDTTIHSLQYTIKDSYGNTSKLSMRMKGTLLEKEADQDDDSSLNVLGGRDTQRTGTAPPYNNPDSGGGSPGIPESIYQAPVAVEDMLAVTDRIQEFRYQFPNDFEAPGIKVHMDASMLYEDLMFEYKRTDTIKGAYSPTHHIHNIFVPVHGKYDLSITTTAVPERLKAKALIARVNGKGRTYYLGGAFNGDVISTRPKKLGSYTVLLDTIAPKVKGVNIFDGKNLSKASTIKMSIRDNLSGIKDFDATIDGQWVLMEYEPKQALLTFDFDDLDTYVVLEQPLKDKKVLDETVEAEDTKKVEEKSGPQKRIFKLTVIDNRGNKTLVTYQFKR